MADKKKTDDMKAISDDQLPVAHEQVENADPIVEPSIEVHYATSRWAGHEQYLCKYCAFDSLELGVMIEHLFWAHSIL